MTHVPASEPVALTAWRKVCALVSGAALSPTVDVLRAEGVLAALRDSDVPQGVSDLAGRHGLHEGYAHVAMGLLATQGLAVRETVGGTRNATVLLTSVGRAWAACGEAYAGSAERMHAAREIRGRLLGTVEPASPPFQDSLDGSGLEQRLSLHRVGARASAIVGALGRVGALRRMYQAPLGWSPVEALGPPVEALAEAWPLLEALGWIAREGDLVALTPEGRGAARWAPLFNYVYGYLGVYERATGLLRGEPLGPPDEARDESDRELLLTGKAYVFRTGLRGPLAELLGPLFEADDGPRVVVDMNAGDGTVLRAVAEMARAAAPGRDPTLIALVRNPLAEARCQAALDEVEATSLVLQVDFTHADAVAATLEAHGIRLRDALVVSKTTIHDRTFVGGNPPDVLPAQGSPSTAVFVSPAGDWIEPTAMEDDLAGFFAGWRRHLGPHGMIAIDTHATPADVAARTYEENAVTHIAASHGYSSQYLIECERFREAARRAGLNSRYRRDLGTEQVEAVTMSLDHFVPA